MRQESVARHLGPVREQGHFILPWCGNLYREMVERNNPNRKRVMRLKWSLHLLTPKHVPFKAPQLHFDCVRPVGVAPAGEEAEILIERVSPSEHLVYRRDDGVVLPRGVEEKPSAENEALADWGWSAFHGQVLSISRQGKNSRPFPTRL